MPYKNPNPGARRSFGIKVVSIGRYRMLKDLETGRILKTKSEISALQEFLDWLKVAKGEKDGVILVCHEPTRKVLIPLLLEALYRFNLVRFKKYHFGDRLKFRTFNVCINDRPSNTDKKNFLDAKSSLDCLKLSQDLKTRLVRFSEIHCVKMPF
jgi:hypothetical protein